jgi:hypothetical protein
MLTYQGTSPFRMLLGVPIRMLMPPTLDANISGISSDSCDVKRGKPGKLSCPSALQMSSTQGRV